MLRTLLSYSIIMLCCAALNMTLLNIFSEHTVQAVYAQDIRSDSTQIYVVKHSWHAGIIIPVVHIYPDSLPVIDEFPGKDYLEIGWGDSVFYQSENPNFGQTLKAGGLPTPAILHVVGIDSPLTDYLNFRTALQFTLSRQDLKNLVDFFDAEFIYNAQGEPIKTGLGLYGDSYFYRARSQYTVFNNCNHWTADALKAAGISVRKFGMFRVETLFKRLRKHADNIE